MKDRWINASFEEDELKPFMEPELDISDQKRIGTELAFILHLLLVCVLQCLAVEFCLTGDSASIKSVPAVCFDPVSVTYLHEQRMLSQQHHVLCDVTPASTLRIFLGMKGGYLVGLF